MWPEFSPPRSQPLCLQLLQHVAVADRGALERDALPRQRLLETEVGHQRADDTAGERLAAVIVHRDHIEQLVAVVRAAVAVDHQQAIAVAVERDADVGPVRDHRRLQVLRLRRADSVIDVEPVRLRADGDDVGAQLVEYRRRHVYTPRRGRSRRRCASP